MTTRLMAAIVVLAAASLAGPAVAGDRVVARVGKAPVTDLEVLALQAEGGDLTYAQARDSLIERALVLAWAAKRGMSVTDRDVDSVVASLRKKDSLTQEQFEKALAAEGMDIQALRERVRDQLLVNKALSAGLADRLAVSDAEIEKAYREQYPPRHTLTVSHILLRLARDATSEEVARREAEARDLLVRIQAGEPFADAARERSDDASSAAKGGSLGTFSSGELMPELEKAAEGLALGQAAGPVRTALGYHLLMVTARAALSTPLEKVRDRIVSGIQAEREKPARDAWIADLRKEFTVEVFPSEK